MGVEQDLVDMGYTVLDNDYRSSNGEIFKLGYRIESIPVIETDFQQRL